MRMQAWYYLATGAWTTGTLSFNPNASETVRAVAFVIPAGQFETADPIGWANTNASAGTAESNVNSPTGTTEADDGSGRIYIAFGSDADALTVPGSNWNTINKATGGGVGLCVGTRDALAGNSESLAALTATITSDSWASLAFVVKPNVVANEVYIDTSANITAGGEATTARLTAPSSKTTGDFDTGRRWDDGNGTDSTNITIDNYTELEWKSALSSALVDTDYVEFRVYAGAAALAPYPLTPKWTVGTGVSAVVTGTITSATTEADIVAGGKTIIITLTGDTWIAAGAGSFDLQRDEILQGLDSAQSETLGWNLTVRDLEPITSVVRTSDTVVTITLGGSVTYNITAQETITCTVPATAVVGGNAIVATPTFTVTQTSTSPIYSRLERSIRGLERGVAVGV
jgi:hypothetical protein